MRRLCIILIFLMLSFPVKLIGDEPPNYPLLRAALPLPDPLRILEIYPSDNLSKTKSSELETRVIRKFEEKKTFMKAFNYGKEEK